MRFNEDSSQLNNRLYLDTLRERSQSQGLLIQSRGQGINPWQATKEGAINKECM